MTEQTTEIKISSDKLSADDFQVNAQGDVVVKNKRIAELIKNSVVQQPGSGMKPAAIKISIET